MREGESGRSHANSCRFFLTGRFFGECRRHMPLRPAGRTRIRRLCVHYRYMWITSDTVYLMETSRNLPGGKAPGARVRVRFRDMVRPFRTGGNGEGSRNSGQDHGTTPGDTESVLFPLGVGSSRKASDPGRWRGLAGRHQGRRYHPSCACRGLCGHGDRRPCMPVCLPWAASSASALSDGNLLTHRKRAVNSATVKGSGRSGLEGNRRNSRPMPNRS